MSARSLLLLAVVTAAALATLVAVRHADEAPPSGSLADGEPLLPELGALGGAIERLRARAAGGTPVAVVEHDGGRWRVANRDGYPADEQALRATLIALADARRLEAKTNRAEGYVRLGVEDVEAPDAGGVELRLESGGSDIGVIIGKPAAAGGGTYVRRLGDRRAWRVSGEIERRSRVGDWLDDRLVDIPAEQLREVRIQPEQGRGIVVRRESPESPFELANMPAGRRPLSGSIARSLARIVTDLRLDDVRPAAGSGPSARLGTARFETFPGLVIELEAIDRRVDGSGGLVRLRASAVAGAGEAVRDRAARLNARYEGWLYRIPDYKFTNVTQTLDGVLEPESGE